MSVLDLQYDFPIKLRNLEGKQLKHSSADTRWISREELTDEERVHLLELYDFICDKMDEQQKYVLESMLLQTNEEKHRIFEMKKGDNVVKTPITILNAPAGTGKTMVTLAYQVKVNLDFGYKNGAIMYTPSYASLHAVTDKIMESFEEIDFDNYELMNKKTKIVSNCLSIKVLNQFFACGSDSFNIHDSSVAAKVIQKFKRAKIQNEYDHFKINNVQAIRESRAIICDEAFFSTSNRCSGFIDMLTEGYIDHPYMNKTIRDTFTNFLDHNIYRKKLVFVGDPYQLSVSVEVKDPGIEKYLHEEGKPLWELRNKLRDSVCLKENIDDPKFYQLLTLTKNYRYSNVPQDLKEAIISIRKVVYKGEEGHDEYKDRMHNLLKVMMGHNMIEYRKGITDVVNRIENEDQYKLYTISEIKETSKRINEHLDDNNNKRFIPHVVAPCSFVYGKRTKDKMQWIPYNDMKNELKDELKDFINFDLMYDSECKHGAIANKFIGPENPKDNGQRKIYINDKIRFTYPLKAKQHDLKRVLNDSKVISLPDNFNIPTGTFGRILGFEKGTRTVFIEICNDVEAQKFNTELGGEKTVTLKSLCIITTNKPVFAIKHSSDLGDPYFKSAFCDYIIREKSFNVAVHSYPFTKESSSTIQSLQGKTIDEKEKIIYFMKSFKKEDLKGNVCNEVGAWKGSLPNLLYVAITRSKVPQNNFKLMTPVRSVCELLKLITSGKRPTSYQDLEKFNRNFERLNDP